MLAILAWLLEAVTVWDAVVVVVNADVKQNQKQY